jgi:hypothetical protein
VTTVPTPERLRHLVPEPASRVQATVAVASATAFIVFLAVHTHRGSNVASTKAPAPTTPASAPAPTAVSPARLSELATSGGQPIYWVGPRTDTTYELSRKGTNLFLRYLPRGVSVGDKRLFLTVGTYTEPNAFAVTEKAAAEEHRANRGRRRSRRLLPAN